MSHPPRGLFSQAAFGTQDVVKDIADSDDGETLALTVGDRVVRADLSGTSAVTVTLPPVQEARGMIFTIHATIADTAALTVQDNDESEDFDGDYTLDANGDALVLFSDGRKWFELANEIA